MLLLLLLLLLLLGGSLCCQQMLIALQPCASILLQHCSIQEGQRAATHWPAATAQQILCSPDELGSVRTAWRANAYFALAAAGHLKDTACALLTPVPLLVAGRRSLFPAGLLPPAAAAAAAGAGEAPRGCICSMLSSIPCWPIQLHK